MGSTMRVFVLGSERNEATVDIVDAWRLLGLDARLVTGEEALDGARAGDTVVARLDVLPTLDGVEPGLLALLLLERRGLRVVNTTAAILGAHDKLRTARLLHAARVPHPRTVAIRGDVDAAAMTPPLVLKPRFGSWGRDVFRCDTPAAVAGCLEEIRDRPWFRRHGAIVQELLPSHGHDLRIVVAGSRAVGSARRLAAPGEWRTNASLGGTVEPAPLAEPVAELACRAAAAVGAELVGVDVLPLPGEAGVVLELNGAVEFDERYALGARSVFAEAAEELGLLPAVAAAR